MKQPQSFTERQYVGDLYPQYLLTRHWQKIKDQLITSNYYAKCWICGKTSTLLLHHVSYENLFNEKLFKDVYILCFDCHTRVHFRKRDGMRVPLKKDVLLRRMRFLKWTNSIRNFRLGSFINYLFRHR